MFVESDIVKCSWEISLWHGGRVFTFTLEPLTELFALTATRVSVKRTAGRSGRKMFLRVPFTKKYMIQAIQLFWVVSTIMQHYLAWKHRDALDGKQNFDETKGEPKPVNGRRNMYFFCPAWQGWITASRSFLHSVVPNCSKKGNRNIMVRVRRKEDPWFLAFCFKKIK